MARLVVNREEADLVTHELTRDIITIGSARLNHIVIDDPAVSAQHAILARFAGSYRLKDLHSTNGTQVNGVSITDAELKDGDKIEFGAVVAVFCGTLQTLMKQMSSSLAGPLILPVLAQIERERESDGNGANSLTIFAQINFHRCRNRSLNDCRRCGMVFGTQKRDSTRKVERIIHPA